METRSCEAKRFPSNFPGGAKRTSVDTRGVSAGTGSVCKLFVRKAQREKGGEKWGISLGPLEHLRRLLVCENVLGWWANGLIGDVPYELTFAVYEILQCWFYHNMRYDSRVRSKARKSEFSSAWPIVAKPWETLADLFVCVKVSKCFKSPSPIWNAANTLKQALLSKEKAAPGPLQFRRSLAKAQQGMLGQLEDVGCWMINRIILRSLQNLVLTLKVQTWLNVTDGFVNRDNVTSVVHKSHITMHLLCVQSSFDPSRKTNNYVF